MNTFDSDSEAAVDDQAVTWLCERAEGFAPGRAEVFAAWCGEDPRHAAAVARVERSLALLDEMPAVRGALEARVGTVPVTMAGESKAVHIEWIRPMVWLAAAAAIVLLAGVAWRTGAERVPAEERHVAATATQRMVLRDGSTLELNAGTEVQVRFTDRERAVRLSVGEAHFQVAHDPARPFVVTAGNVHVRAVGTAFNVRLAPAGVDVLVTQGRVRVQRAIAAAVSAAGPAAAAELGAGERTVIDATAYPAASAPFVERVSAEAMRTLLAWQNPLVTFTDTPLRDVVRQFNRRNTVQLVLADAELGARNIGGVIALDQVEAFVRLLEQGGDVVAAPRVGDEIVLRRTR